MAFKTETAPEKPKEPSRFKLMIIDADTPVYVGSRIVQKDFIKVKFKKTGSVKRYDNVTQFWGHFKNKSGGALQGFNAVRLEKGLTPYTPEDFEIEQCCELDSEIENHLETAITSFDFFIGRMKALNLADDYRIVLGGSNNFRYEAAQILPYKKGRVEKPLLFKEVKDAIVAKYKSKVLIADGEEADDMCSYLMEEDNQNFKKTGKREYILARLDKDLNSIEGFMFNYQELNPEIIEQSEYAASLFFCTQLVSGDLSVDNIPGLPNFTDEVREKYGLGKTKGIGFATAAKYLSGCIDIKEMYERVVFAYKSYYGEEKIEFVSHRGEKFMWDWKDYLDDNAKLLYLRKTKGEMVNIIEIAESYGVNCG